MSETCSHCGQPCEPALFRQKVDGTREPLCQKCSEEWLDQDENWPPERAR